jgi:hypothetical protein
MKKGEPELQQQAWRYGKVMLGMNTHPACPEIQYEDKRKLRIKLFLV